MGSNRSLARESHGRVIVVGFPPRRPGFDTRSGMWDLWWTKWHWDRFSLSTSFSHANSHSTDYSTFIIIIYHPGLVTIG
jgi:hypothetical protein